jgi:hypothetical protein
MTAWRRRGKIGEVEHFCYLGVLLDCEAGLDRTVRARVAASWSSWREVYSLLVNGGIPVKNRSRVYVVCIRSMMLYGAESWALTSRVENILRFCDHRMLRCMAGVRWQYRVSSEEVTRRCGVEEIVVELRRRRLRWLGHVTKAEEETVLRLSEDLQLGGRCLLGRPRKTWRSRIQNDMDILCLEEGMAQDRGEWKRFIRTSNPIVFGEDR